MSLFATGATRFIVTGSKVVSVASGQLAGNIDFQLTATSATISGSVTDANGGGLAGYLVSAQSSFTTVASNITDSSGHYVLDSGLTTGTYNVTASPLLNSTTPQPLSKIGETTVSGLQVTAGRASTVNLVIRPVFATVVGTITNNKTGAPVPGAEVSATVAASLPTSTNMTDSQGRFFLRVPLPSGMNSVYALLSVNASGYTPVELRGLYTGGLQLSPGQQVTQNVVLNPAPATPAPNAVISGVIQGQVLSTGPPERTSAWPVPSFVTSTVVGTGTPPVARTTAVVTTDSDLAYVDMFHPRQVTIVVAGPVGGQADLAVAISTKLMVAPWTTTIDGARVTPQVVSENSSYTTLKVSYPAGPHVLVFAGQPSTGGSSSSSSTASAGSSSTAGAASSSTSSLSTSVQGGSSSAATTSTLQVSSSPVSSSSAQGGQGSEGSTTAKSSASSIASSYLLLLTVVSAMLVVLAYLSSEGPEGRT